jgi:putative tryptophan/tyrosine transport system substrate-binding protein
MPFKYNGRIEGWRLCAEPQVNLAYRWFCKLGIEDKIPVWGAREYVEPRGLLSYGPNFPNLFRRAAEITDKILRGAKPTDIPVEQPTKFDFVINLITAKALGLTIPESLLLRADKVIE